MRFISTKTHAVLDYITGALLIAVPLYYVGEGGAAIWIPIIIGVVLLMQSLITNYELSVANFVPVPAHLGMDAVAGIVLAASPWLFDFHERVWLPHLAVGVMEIALALTTRLRRSEAIRYPNPPHGAASV